MTRLMRRMDSATALPSGGSHPPLPEALWVNTNTPERVQGFRWLESSPAGLRARCPASGADFVWPADDLVRYCGISTPELVAFSAHRSFEDSEILLQGILNLGLLVLATYETPRGGGPGYFSREFFARRAALTSSSEPAAKPAGTTTLFGHLAKPTSLDTTPLLGRWRNADCATRGLVEITVESTAGDLTVRALGNGEGEPVDWGPGRTDVFACLDEAGKASLSLLAAWDFGSLETHLQLRIPAGTLASAGFNVFQDERPSYFTREFFYRD